MSSKGEIYLDEGHVGGQSFLRQLHEAVNELEHKMKASVPIKKGNFSGSRVIGYGVSKAQRGIAADSVISIARAIKALKGW